MYWYNKDYFDVLYWQYDTAIEPDSIVHNILPSPRSLSI